MLLAGFGAGLLLPTAANSVLGSIPRAEAGIGSGTYGVAIQIGSALGVAVMGSALSSRYQNHITSALASHRVPEPVLHTITGSLGGALGVASGVGGLLGALLAHAARAAFMSGVHLSLGFGALAASVAALAGARGPAVAYPVRWRGDLRDPNHDRGAIVIALILANLRRRKARTALTAAGISIGVAAIVALLALSAGLNQTAGQLVHLGRADLGLFQRDAGDPTSSVLPLSLLPRLRAQPEIIDATPIQLVVSAVPRAPSAIVFGIDPSGFVARRLVYTAGHGPAPGQAVLGDLLASQLHLAPGDSIKLGQRTFVIAGIYHSGIAFEDQGVITTLADAQALAGRTSERRPRSRSASPRR